ncbi:bifunctional metallophosphatase/5'-nucleotidase [Apilactobacillus apisilvae]|uniref:Bifunctional metallophosphatase/5'-nucleotidase n=1 Tax=Apilactobacillus apisilvae TaxID=2923364 RepID=A0ABY4PHA8_9LACO|nr:bifunctional UDP-sugar hydrolase/5'-nucleotidase [Apilactobacillus apisilvae]UQS85218.1 bifunctional metallophosphatase/5'-nucleotidase [Apilactobacillus apisilvae]
MSDKIAILHTNDLHSHFENWPKIVRYLYEEKRKLQNQGYFVITVDLGDALDRAHPLTEATNGKANVKLLNEVHYDAVTIGNNEGLTNSKQQLDHLYDDANFDVILDNLVDLKTGNQPDWSKKYKIITTTNNTKIKLLGLTAPYHSTYELENWNPIDDQKMIPDLLKDNSKSYDVLVLLSHLGVTQDRLTANKFPQFDIIIGSHTHHLFEHGEYDNQTLLAAAGKYGHYVGEIKLDVDNGEVVNKTASVVKTSDLKTLSSDEKYIKELEQRGEAILSKSKIANIPYTMHTSLRGEPSIVKEGLEAMKKKAGTDAAIINDGLFLDDLSKGIVDKNQLHKILPHSMHVTKTTLSGSDLWRMIMEMEKNRKFLVNFEQKGMGFRGKYFGELNYSGISIDIGTKEVYYNDKLVKDNEKYSIAILDHYLFIPFFPTIDIMGDNRILYDETLRDVFADHLSRKYPLNNN